VGEIQHFRVLIVAVLVVTAECFEWLRYFVFRIISLYRVNGLAFVTKTNRVYCAVRAESVQAIHNILHVDRAKRRT
jgi:hypothetical protein